MAVVRYSWGKMHFEKRHSRFDLALSKALSDEKWDSATSLERVLPLSSKVA